MDAVRFAAALLAIAMATPASADPVARWQPDIAQASQRFGIPEGWIIHVVRAESGGMTEVDGHPIRSRAGAIGLMQLMPSTWASMRAAYGLGNDPDDPRDNIIAGTAYLRLLYDRFGYPGLFGAYNAGPTRYADYLAGRAHLPGETIAYLGSVTGKPERSIVPGPPSRQLLFALRHDFAGVPDSTAAAPVETGLFAVRKGGE
ncbi:MAG: lytic transglycosylase [Bradyrhizobium sp.]|nr:lytic transglycosylase [Bradyrhizobium sp.]